MGKYFGTDGIRGQYGTEPLTQEFAYRMGAALRQYLIERRPNSLINVVIGRDTRASGEDLSDALAMGLVQGKGSVYLHDAGVVPTPAISFTVRERMMDLGIVITASHNPAKDNGIKLFNHVGCKFDETEELLIESLIDAQPGDPNFPDTFTTYPLDAASFYTNKMRALLDQNCLNGWKVVLDLANGATSQTTPAVFRRWGAELFLMGDEPDGHNINLEVGSEHPKALGAAVVKNCANIGIAHDGDGDRLIVCDETGAVVDGDVILALFGMYAQRVGALSAQTLVATVHSNLGLDRAIESVGGKVERVAVGDRNVAKCMREIGSNIGGESSGHIIFSDFAVTGDGLLAAVKVIELMLRTGKKLSELAQEVSLFPQCTANLRVSEKLPLEGLKRLSSTITEVESALGENGRVLVRYSGTEPKLRLLVEGVEESQVEAYLKKIEKAARADLTVIDS